MWGPGRKGRRLRRAGATFSLIGLVMTVFLAIGQVGLIAANADGWSDRSGDGSASAEGGRGDGFTKTVDTDRVRARQTEAKQVFEAAAQQDSLNVNLDQYANQDAEWQNGNLNGNNSQYAEGDVVPFRLAIEGLTTGSHTIHINYDFTAGGHEAYDFLATWDVTETPGLCDAGGGAVSSMCPGLGGADTQAFPSDPFAPGGTTQAGLTVAGAEAASGVSRQLTMYGGTITSITGPVHSGPTSGNSTGDFTVTFNSSDSAVLLAWGGHLADSTYWKTTGGDPNGAAEVSGSPWHMRTQQLDGSGNKNQDRSIQPSAIFRPSVEIFKEVVDGTGAPITEVSPGESFTYQILVTNGGNADATGVVVTDDLENSLTVDSATWEVTGGSPSACTVGAGNTIRCPAGSGTATIPAGDSMLVVIDVTAPNTCGPLLNTAHVDWNEAPTEAGLDSSQVTVDVTGCAPDLSIDKEAVNEAGAPITDVSPGDSFSYVITVTNDGNADATGVVVTDDLDDTLTIDSASYAIDGGASSDCDIASGNAIRCPQDPGTETLQPGESMVVTIDVTTAADICGALINSAHVDWTEDGSGEGLDSNLVTVDVTGCAPDLTIAKTGPATVPFGGQVTYEVTVENTGNASTADDVIITDSVPAELDNVAATYSFNGGADQACSVVGNDVSCNVGVMDPGDSVVVTITADAPSDSCPSFTNQAFVGELGSNEIDTDVTGCAADLELHKTGPATAEVGGLVTYTVTVQNNGNAATADPVVVTDAVDSDLSGVTASFSLNGGADQACDVVGNDVSCDLGILDPGDSAEITISGTTPTDICPEIVNQAFIGDLGSEIVTTTIDCPPPGIDLVKGGDEMAHVGDTVTYTFDVSLTPDSLPLNNVTLTDPICDAGTISGPTGDDGNSILEQGETWGYTCTHVVTEGDPDPLPNTAHVSGWFGETEVTDEDSHEVDIIHPAIEIVKQARPQSGSPGETITYHYTVTNIGDVVLHDITVDDDVIGHVCDIAELLPGESAECTKDFELPSDGTIKVTNVGTAEGEDPLGETVKDDDTQTVDVILGQTITKTPPGPIAFTGTSSVIPLGALLLVFVTAGTALLWVGRRRGRQTSTE